MKESALKSPSRIISLVVVGISVVIAAVTYNRWAPIASTWLQTTVGAMQSDDDAHQDDAHDHAAIDPHAEPGKAHTLDLSPQGLRNIGLTDQTIRPVALQTFQKSITVPGVVVERHGRSRVQVATPMTGVVTHVHAVHGEAVEPGTLLFEIRLTHEDLVQAQTEFLRTLGELDVEQREIARLENVTRSGAVAGKVLLERQYSRDKLQALLNAQREALRLHGLSDDQVEQIARTRRLLRELQIFAPTSDAHDDDELHLTGDVIRPVNFQKTQKHDDTTALRSSGPLVLDELMVHKGQSVKSGETLAVLAFYDELFIEGLAFEQDIAQLRHASLQEWKVDAAFDFHGTEDRVVHGLQIAHLANRVDPLSRTMAFYVRLPNEITLDRKSSGHRYVEWRYLPGQRLQLRIPVEKWTDQIVLPVDAVAREGAEFFVFRQNGDHFDRVPVHVKYRDQTSAVIENDGSLFVGDVIAMRGAHQMQMALKNMSGGAVDPHAGHSH